jgi:hypothetical protein
LLFKKNLSNSFTRVFDVTNELSILDKISLNKMKLLNATELKKEQYFLFEKS